MKFLESPPARFHHRTKEIENYPRRCILPDIQVHTSIFTRWRGYSKRAVLCSRAKVIGDIHTCLRFRFLAVLNIERAGRVRPYVGEDVLQLRDFTLIPCILAGHWNRVHRFNQRGHPLEKWIDN